MSLSHDLADALDAVVDVHEAAGLLAVAPDLDLVLAGLLGVNHLAADRGRRLFAAAVPGAVRAVDIVEAGDARRTRPKSSRKWRHIRSEKSFSQP